MHKRTLRGKVRFWNHHCWFTRQLGYHTEEPLYITDTLLLLEELGRIAFSLLFVRLSALLGHLTSIGFERGSGQNHCICILCEAKEHPRARLGVSYFFPTLLGCLRSFLASQRPSKLCI